jgi:arginyl-tRNA synthetase
VLRLLRKHFELIAGAARMAGWLQPPPPPASSSSSQPTASGGGAAVPVVRIDHAGFGLVLGADGKRLASRAMGRDVDASASSASASASASASDASASPSAGSAKLVALLDTAKARCLQLLRERHTTPTTAPAAAADSSESGGAAASAPPPPRLSESELEATAAALGYSAVKYCDLRQHRIKDYPFSYERMLDLRGSAHTQPCLHSPIALFSFALNCAWVTMRLETRPCICCTLTLASARC